MMSRWVFVAGTVALAIGPTQAASLLTQLTPTNLGRQQLAITIRCASTSQGEQFSVIVRHKAGIPYHFLKPTEGCLKTGPFVNGTEGDPLPYRITVSEQGKGAVAYHFTLPAHYRENTRFEFGYTGYDTGTLMPVGDFYWFTISAFVHLKTRVRA